MYRTPNAVESSAEIMNALQLGEMAISRTLRELGTALNPQDAARIVRRMGDQAVQGQPLELPPALGNYLRRANRDIFRELTFCIDDIAIRRIWNATRIAYDMDPDLWDELGETDDGDLIHPETLTYLPHPNPYIAFPRPIVLDHGGTDTQHVNGVLILGRKKGRVPDQKAALNNFIEQHTSTTESETLSLVFCGRMFRHGEPVWFTEPETRARIADYSFTRTSLVFPTGEPMTFGEMIEQIGERFTFPYYDNQLGGDPVEDMKRMVRRALATVLYACADGADYDKQPSPVVKQAVRGRRTLTGAPVKPPKAYNLGFRMGAALRAWKARIVYERGPGGTGIERSPHIRKAHFHTFRIGKNRAHRRVKWLPPIPVKMDFTGEADVTTVIPVQ